ncbi:hypothetical protein CBR_g4589 [Chara braunii]|uniref:Coiled-coil domain-containing protein 86 n=1 Tax=Chara braunii TaxID=69332 RepID=A0A388KIB8_CHABU|nr:hypothetical protein CBR_g4589 [Chara braunii]|eukprot:GBG69758.1 hypothetical protein CBR_g4589 [Chara braunii]
MVDFRGLDEGLGHRQKRKREFEKLEEDLQAAKRIAVPMDEGAGKAEIEKVLSRTDPKTLGGMVSGRKWKVAATTRTSALGRSKPLQTSWDEKMRQKDVKKMFQERKSALKEDIRSRKQEKRRKKEEFMKRKEENTLKSAPVQKISNPKTTKKMMKSKNKRKQLQKVAE